MEIQNAIMSSRKVCGFFPAKVLFLVVGLGCGVLNPVSLSAQEDLSWEVLADVTFDERYDRELNVVWLIPNFGRQPKSYQGKTVVMKGFFIPLDIENRFFVLSKNPYSACFFCGGAGPETVVELDIDAKAVRHLRMDQQVRFQGKLRLNRADFDHLNYQLSDAKLLPDK